MDLLIVEDDLFKYSRIEKIINKKISITKLDNIRDSVNWLESNIPDKIILDMSLPCHKINKGEGTPVSMPNGGIEIIMELKYQGKVNIPIIILTQYEDIEIENIYYDISQSTKVIKELYNVNIQNVIFYDNDSIEWESKLKYFLEGKN